MSISDINVERGFSNTSNSDIHDLYNDFPSWWSSWMLVNYLNPINQTLIGIMGPVSGFANDQDNVIRFDEFYGTTMIPMVEEDVLVLEVQ